MKRFLFEGLFLQSEELFQGSDVACGYIFKMISTRNDCALLAKANRQLRQGLALLWDKSTLLAVICPIQTALSELKRGKYAHFQKRDCFECLSPQKSVA